METSKTYENRKLFLKYEHSELERSIDKNTSFLFPSRNDTKSCTQLPQSMFF